jgi:5'-3' exonuclease
MGVPKFFRWLSERYPKINQRLGVLPSNELFDEHFNNHVSPPSSIDEDEEEGVKDNQQKIFEPKEIPLTSRTPDPLSLCSQGVPIDRLYIDMNGILHGCSHNNSSQSGDEVIESSADITEPEIFQNVCYYLDRVVKEVAKPKSLIYLAIDGPAPRAKLNQQRSRRYRSGKEGLIEETIYDAHARNLRMKQSKQEEAGSTDDSSSSDDEKLTDHDDEPKGSMIVEENAEQVEEVEPGRFAGKLLAHLDSESDQNEEDELFHSNFSEHISCSL